MVCAGSARVSVKFVFKAVVMRDLQLKPRSKDKTGAAVCEVACDTREGYEIKGAAVNPFVCLYPSSASSQLRCCMCIEIRRISISVMHIATTVRPLHVKEIQKNMT